MATLGMQAGMQLKSQSPGCYTSWDLNLGANGAVWPTDDVDRISRNRQYYNGTLPSSSDLNMFYNKDLLAQTMLKHEAEFRDQINELHRLYRRQKELMDEMKKNDLYKHHHSLETLQPNHFLPPVSSNYVPTPHQTSTSTSTNLVRCQPPISEAKGSILPLHSYDGIRGQTGLEPTCISSSSKASEFMQSNCKKFGKKILDLELPADEYFDSEEEGFSEVKMAPEVTDIPTNALKKIPEVRDRGDKELSICSSGCNSVFPEGNFIHSSISLKKNVMADLNIPLKLEEDIIPESSEFQDPVVGHRETSLQDPYGKSNSNFQVLSKEVIPNSQIMKDPEAQLENLLLNEHKLQRECISCNDKAGQGRNDLNSFPQDLYTEKSSIEHINNEQAQDCAICHGLDETDGKLCNENLQHVARVVSASNYKPVATSDMFSSYQIVPLADTMKSESSSVSSGRHAFKRSPIAVQALPCFKRKSSKSFTVSPGLAGNELCLGKNSLSTFLQASSQTDFQLECQSPSTSSLLLNCNNDINFAFEHSPVKYTKDFEHVRSIKSSDLNFVLPSFSTNVAGSQDASHRHGENTLENSTVCYPNTAEMAVHDTKSVERGDPSIPLESALEQSNSQCVHDAELEKVEASNSLDFKRILGFHLYNKPPIANGQCSSHAFPSRNHPNSCVEEDIKDKVKDRIPDINLEFDHLPDSEKDPAKTKSVTEIEPCEKYPGYGVIDLNSCLSMDESLLMPSHSTEIDLEPPASPENKECSPPRGESNENQLETPLLSSGQEDGDLQEELVRNAVEAIVSISSSETQTCLDSTTCEPFKASNSLYWFARVASSVVDDPGSEFGVNIGVKDYGDHEEYLSDGIDYFEAMTLNLTEIKVEESWCKSNGLKEEESFLTNQPKKGRTRRGRQQRKDFQSEILPSLASLSRYEVTEDLQMIGGLMEAAGAQWESSYSRDAGRNGYTKGRRRSNARASSVMDSGMNMLLKQQSGDSEAGIRQRRLIEWGKITRRPRGPRCPSSNPRLILSQV
ncbi:uncharacterized protein LOC111283930 [Durio zibethinus]|uniref:Uncharacterized protein LOC111283930 n=1 Tax=Durio zibethinus TaxID=66656 RepID=A0A6P5XKI4_DURZI|nr:uncharacterized protein LOC111283930 [Durio zibethinus]